MTPYIDTRLPPWPSTPHGRQINPDLTEARQTIIDLREELAIVRKQRDELAFDLRDERNRSDGLRGALTAERYVKKRWKRELDDLRAALDAPAPSVGFAHCGESWEWDND